MHYGHIDVGRIDGIRFEHGVGRGVVQLYLLIVGQHSSSEVAGQWGHTEQVASDYLNPRTNQGV